MQAPKYEVLRTNQRRCSGFRSSALPQYREKAQAIPMCIKPLFTIGIYAKKMRFFLSEPLDYITPNVELYYFHKN